MRAVAGRAYVTRPYGSVFLSYVSVRDVAGLVGVPVGTVSNVLNRLEKVSDQMVECVHRAISNLGFVHNDTGRNCVSGAVLSGSTPGVQPEPATIGRLCSGTVGRTHGRPPVPSAFRTAK